MKVRELEPAFQVPKIKVKNQMFQEAENRGLEGSASTVCDRIMRHTCHYVFVLTRRTYNTDSEPRVNRGFG